MAAASALLPFLLLLLSSSLPPSRSDQASERAALLAFRSAVGRNVLPRWNASSHFCTWRGVTCDTANATTTELRLPGARLSGPIPPGVFGNLTALRSLSLRFNALSGSLPADIASCSFLEDLVLYRNRLSGEFPAMVLSLRRLARLNLAGNRFSGDVPAGLGSLKELERLELDGNRFSGEIPDLDLPRLKVFNVSFNLLNGSIPARLRSWPSEAFLGMPGLCGGPLLSCPGEGSPAPPPSGGTPDDGGGGKKKKLSTAAITGIAIGCIIGMLMLVALLFVICRKCGGRRASAVEAGVSRPPESDLQGRKDKGGAVEVGNYGTGPVVSTAAAGAKGESASAGNIKKLLFFEGEKGKVFDLEDLLRASAEVLGKGTFGTTYKAVLEMGMVVAVKRLKDVELGEREFKDRIEDIGEMEHRNLVRLKAYYYSRDEKLLVYDYMPIGSLSAALHGNTGTGRILLDWVARLNIALAASRGIEYIHSRGPGVSHGNVKSSNILLDKAYDACISDHGLAQLAHPSSTSVRATGYRAPEVTDTRRVSQQADVYSFGIVLLELLMGKSPEQALPHDEGADLPRWVSSFSREEWTSEVFDLDILQYPNVQEDMMLLMQLAIDCARQYPDSRPTMSDVVVRIEQIKQQSLARANTDQLSNESGSPAHVMED